MTLEERVKKLEQEVSVLKRQKLNLKGLKVGDCFELADSKWRILDITSKGYHCLAEPLIFRKQFDSESNNWCKSALRKWLNNEYLEKLAETVGKENIIEFESDLLSLDGQTEYGKCVDEVSLLTVDEYRKYRKLIPNVGVWSWLLTPWSTKCNEDDTLVAVVSSSGIISNNCCCNFSGVRPFCIFASAIFESEEE